MKMECKVDASKPVDIGKYIEEATGSESFQELTKAEKCFFVSEKILLQPEVDPRVLLDFMAILRDFLVMEYTQTQHKPTTEMDYTKVSVIFEREEVMKSLLLRQDSPAHKRLYEYTMQNRHVPTLTLEEVWHFVSTENAAAIEMLANTSPQISLELATQWAVLPYAKSWGYRLRPQLVSKIVLALGKIFRDPINLRAVDAETRRCIIAREEKKADL